MERQALDLAQYGSIVADNPYSRVSDKYNLIPTTRIVNTLDSLGWYPVQASEVNCRNANRKGFQKHLLRFRNDSLPQISGGNLPEIVLTNSHDGKASFCIMAGIFRLVCSNGLIIADSTFQSYKIRHMGYTDQAVREAVASVCDSTPQIASKVNDFQQIELTPDERGVYAQAALVAKYGDEVVEAREFDTDSLLFPRRTVDAKPTLWDTYNVVQEKLMKGARFERKLDKKRPWRTKMVKSRGVKSIHETVRVNQALWQLTEKMAELKRAN